MSHAATSAVRVCALLASHNRRDTTLAALHAFFAQADAVLHLRAVLVDDGSRDGTAAAVHAAFPAVQLEPADGSLYWCRAMHRAMALATAGGGDDYLLWLNDDTRLVPGALARLVDCERSLRRRLGAAVIVIGTTVDAQQRALYGGRTRRSRWRPLSFALLAPTEQPQPVDTMDGNVVLLAPPVVERVGNLEPRFEHAMGDHDYALRAAQAGIATWLAPGVHAQGAANALAGSFDDLAQPLHERRRHLLSRKGLPWRSWLLFTRRHAGWLWPLHFAWPYLRVLLLRRQASAVR